MGSRLVSRRSALARLAGAAAPAPAPLAPGTAICLAALFPCRGFLGQAFGLFGFHFEFDFDVEWLFVAIRFLGLRRESSHLCRQQRLRGFQRVHLFATVNDERLLPAYGGISDHGQCHLEAVFQIAQVGPLVVENIKRNVGSGAHHEIVRGALHQ